MFDISNNFEVKIWIHLLDFCWSILAMGLLLLESTKDQSNGLMENLFFIQVDHFGLPSDAGDFPEQPDRFFEVFPEKFRNFGKVQ